MKDLVISYVQASLHWEDKSRNLQMFSDLLTKSKLDSDLIILPEMFNTGFSMNAVSLCEPMDGESVRWMVETARFHDCVVTGSLIIKEGGHYYNRLLWATPEGITASYDKRHLFSMADEDQYYKEGAKRLVVNLSGWKICPLICYDLRFPVWSRNDDSYDLLIYTANWPAMRIEAWKTLIAARAIENLSYVIGINRIGQDGNGYPYSGDSRVIDPTGMVLYESNQKEEVHTQILAFQDLQEVRKRLPFLKDRDSYSITGKAGKA